MDTFSQKLIGLQKEQQALINSVNATQESLLGIENKISALMRERSAGAFDKPFDKDAIDKKIAEAQKGATKLNRLREELGQKRKIIENRNPR